MRALLTLLCLLGPLTKVRALLPRPGRRSTGTWVQADRPAGRPSTVNCTWKTIEQPIDHFGKTNGTFKQRYCLYDSWWKSASAGGFNATPSARGPILFYTGNESPVDVYVNNTGLMWEIGEALAALLVFAEHRYEPLSHPALCGTGSERCLSYCTTAQALADYVNLISFLQPSVKNGGKVPVIAIGGSYGGMLAGWLRMKHPEAVAGAIAASAPIWMLASTVTRASLDMPAVAISTGVSAEGGADDKCFHNLQAAWPVLSEVGKSKVALQLLSNAANTCQPLTSASEFTSWAKAPYFELAEANYPFPSTYITYAVGPGDYPLPPWPMRVACEHLSKDFGLQITGDTRKVKYSIKMGDIKVDVDWTHINGNGPSLTEVQVKASGVLELAAAIANAAGVWYNVTKDQKCWNLSAPSFIAERSDLFQPELATDAPLAEATAQEVLAGQQPLAGEQCPACPPCKGCPACPLSRCNVNDTKQCNFTGTIPLTFPWGLICCNDDLSEVSASGVGRDFYWPPTVPERNYTVDSIVGPKGLRPGCEPGYLAQGLRGLPMTSDPYSPWLTAYYGGRNITSHRNIVWSNGALDPWSGQGVYPHNGGPGGPMIQKINSNGSQIALVLDLGAHHLDLMFSDPRDPPCAKKARTEETKRIRTWCQEVYGEGLLEEATSVQIV